MPRRENDPYAAYNFLLEIDGITQAGFNEATGLNIENAPIEYREGNEDITARKVPGLMKYANVVIKRGITQNPELHTWVKTVQDGDIERRSVSIVLLDELRQETVRWNLREAWACKWTGADLKAADDAIAFETVEICHEGVERP